jgi:hypothetical protein
LGDLKNCQHLRSLLRGFLI